MIDLRNLSVGVTSQIYLKKDKSRMNTNESPEWLSFPSFVLYRAVDANGKLYIGLKKAMTKHDWVVYRTSSRLDFDKESAILTPVASIEVSNGMSQDVLPYLFEQMYFDFCLANGVPLSQQRPRGYNAYSGNNNPSYKEENRKASSKRIKRTLAKYGNPSQKKECRDKAIETMRKNGTCFFDPENQKSIQRKANAPQLCLECGVTVNKPKRKWHVATTGCAYNFKSLLED